MTQLAGAAQSCTTRRSWYRSPLRELLVSAIHLLVSFSKLLRPGGARAVAAKSLLLKHQWLISNRSLHRAPNLTPFDRFLNDPTAASVNQDVITWEIFLSRKRTFQRISLQYRELKRHPELDPGRDVARAQALNTRRHIQESVKVWITRRAKIPLSGDS